MAKKLYRSQLGKAGEFLNHLDEVERNKKQKENESQSKKLNYGSNISEYAQNFLNSLPDDIKSVTKKSYLEAQAKRLWESPVVAETRASNHSFAPLTTEQLSKAEADRQLALKKQQEEAQAAKQKEEAFRASERDYAARRAALAEKGKTTPVTTDVNPATDWLDYQVKSSQNAGAQSFEDIANGLNAAGAGILADIKTTANAFSGDKTAQEEKKNDIKTTFGKIKDAFEKSRNNPYGTPDEQLTEGDHLGNLRKWWNAVNPVSNAAKAASAVSSTAYNKAVADYLNDNASVDPSEIKQAEIERTHPTQAAKGIYSPTQITKNVLSNTSRMLPQIVFSNAVGGKLGSLAGGATLGLQSVPSAYREAKADGATDEQAVKYANLEFFNQGFGDAALGGISGATTGLLDAPISKLAASITKTPLFKTVIQTAANVAEEGGQEFIQNYISTVNKRLTYNPDAEFDVEGAVYEGVLGGINAIALSPGKTFGQYKVNRSAYETVNNLSKAAGNISSAEEANIITNLANEIVEDANTVLSDDTAENSDKSNAEYIKKGAEQIAEKLSQNTDSIISSNRNAANKVNSILEASDSGSTEAVSELVYAVKATPSGNKGDAINNTVDYVNTLIREQNNIKKTAEQILSAKDTDISENADTVSQAKQTARDAVEYTNAIIPELKKLSETLRSNRNEINSRLKIDENISKQSTQTETVSTPERVSGKAYNSEVAATLRSTYGGSNIKETAENIIKNKGNVRNAVDYVHEVYSKTGGSNSDTATREYLTALDKEIRTANRDYLAKNTARLESALKEYGVSNVEIDDKITPLSDNGKYAWGQAHYDRNTGKIYVSPYAYANSVIGSKIIHEFTHHGAKADTSLVNDILTAARNSKSFNKEVKLSDGTTTNTVDNISSLIRENYANEINEYIALSKNVTRYSELVRSGETKEAAAKTAAEEYRAQNTAEYDSLVKDYIDEDTAAYVMEYLNQDTDVLSKLIEDNRPLWKRILDKIEDFIAKITGKSEAREYQKAADKIRAILESEVDAKVENTGSFTDIQSQLKENNAKIGNTSDGRKFSMELNVDESNGLFAIHNLTADSFMKSYKLGGFAMPSIAIARSDVGHSNFGDISLVFASDTINPANSDNKVYSADAWTPTFPRIEYEANSKVADRLRDKYYELYRKFGQDKVSALYPYGNYFEEQLNTDGGVDGIISKQSDNPQMMQVYLADTQGKTVDSVVKETKTTLPSEQVEQSEFIIDKLGADTVNEMRPQANESPISARKRWMSEHGDAFKAAYTDYLAQSGLTSEEAKNAIDNMSLYQLTSQIVKARNYLANGAETVKSEVDMEATNNAIKKAVNQEDYLKWLHSLFDGGEKKSGVSNGKDPYTRNGNQRPFSATHYPVTLDNIVLSMKSQGDGNAKNATSIFVGSKTIRAESATEYSSLDEIRADKGRLAHRTPEEAKAAWDEFDNRLSAIINRIMDAKSGIGNRFIEQDRIGSVLAEASRNNTEANIKKVLTQYKLTPAVAADFKALVDDIRSAPVDIFEAKPERVVGLDEVKYAIVPSDVNSDVTTALNNAGIETKTYENGNEADRLKVLNTLSDVRFSKQLDTGTSSEITQADVEQLRSIGRKSIFEFTSEDIQKSEKWAKKFYSELGTKSPFFRAWFGDWRENDTGTYKIVKESGDAYNGAGRAHNTDMDRDISWGSSLTRETQNHAVKSKIAVSALGDIQSVIENSIYLDTNISEKTSKTKMQNTAFMHSLYTVYESNGQKYLLKLFVEEALPNKGGEPFSRAYELKDIEKIADLSDGVLSDKGGLTEGKSTINNSISDLYALVKRYDKDFKSQQSSKVVNEDGSPKVVYHGTNADFWTFSLANRGKNGEKLGVGYYFVDDKSSAERYGDRVIEAYLDIKKPASAEVMEISRKDWEKFLDFAIEHRDEYIDGEWKGNEINKEYELTDFDYGSNDAELIKGFLNGIAAGNKDVTEAYLEMLKDSTGYDGVEYTSDGKNYYVAFTPNQIKSVDNLGTFDKSKGDIRYSKQLDANGKEFVRVDDTTINEKNPKDIVKALKQIAESKGFYDMEINGQNIGLSNERGIQEWVYSKDAKSLYRNNKTAFNDKIQSFQNADELIEAAKSYINEEAVHKKKFDSFARGEIRFKVGDNGYLADILIGIRRNQNAELYDIVNITPIKITENSGRYVTDNTVQTGQEFSVDLSVSQTESNVNTNTENSSVNSSTETDNRYSRELLTPEQKKMRRLEERNDFLERQLVQTNPLGGKARAVSPTTKAKIAKQLAAGMPGVRTSEVNEKLTDVFNAIEHSGAGTREEYRDAVTKAAEKAATELYNDFKVDNVNPLYEEFTDLYKHIRGMKFKITDTVKNDMNDFAEFKKSVRGVLRFDNENGLPVDTAYMELYDMQPSLFADNTGEPIGNQGDQLIRIAEVQEKISKEAGHPYQDASHEDDAYIIRTIRDAILSSYVENSKETLASQNKTLKRENEKLSEKASMTDAYAKELRDVRTMYDNQTKEELARIYREFVSQVKDQQKQLEKNSEKIERLNDRISRNNVNAAQKTALREIGRLHDMLTNPTKQKHIPQELRIAVGRYLNTLNGTKLLNGKTVNSEAIKSELSDDYSRILSQIGDVTSKLTRSSLDGKPTDYISASKEQINMLERKVKYISELAHGETVDMSDNIDFIRNITDITRIVNHLVKDSNDLFTGARTEEAVDFANEWKSELSGHKSKVGEIGSERSGLKKWFDGVGYSLMSADLFFGTMGESGEKISGWYRNAQTRQVKMKREYAEYMKKLLGDNYSTIAGSVKARNNLIDVEIAGEKIKVSKNQLMSLYLLWNRPAGRRHIETGGVSFVNKNGETGKTYDIYPRTFDSLMSHLSKDDIRIADGIGDFLSENCSEWGNEASMQLYGIRLYNDPKYFPIRTVSDSIETNFNNLENTHTLENSSFTKKLSKTASAPLAIGDVFDIADRHVNDMSAYSAYAPLNNSISRVFNTEGVKASLRNAYGKAGVMYVENFIDKVNGNSPKTDTSNLADKAMTFIANNAKRAAVSLNISTALKQPLSLIRASLVIDPKYTAKAYAMITPGVNNIIKQGREYNRILDLMNEYSGIAVIKSMGYSDTGFGETTRDTYDEQNLKSAYNKAKYLRDKYDDITMRPAEFADEITWVRMWKACELEAKEKYGSSLSADEFNKKVASRFNEIIGKTQVVDSILDTAPLSTNRLFRTLYPFMNEPVKTAATLVSAAENVRNGKTGAKKQLAKAAACYVISNMLAEPIVSSLVGMWRHDSPDDPEEFAKMFLKRFIGVDIDGETTFADVFTSNVADGIFGVPFIGAWYDVITGKLQGFDPERMDLQPVADLVGNTAYFVKSLEKEDYENQKTKINYFTDMMSSLTQILGVPGSTLKRDLSALARSAVNTVGGYVAQWELNKVYYNLGNANARANKNFFDIMAKAYKAGDTEAYRYMLNDLKKTQVGAKSFGVPYSKMNQYITERGGEIEVGSDMWNVSLQAEYNLPTFNPTMRVEKAVTDIYQKATAAKLKNADNAIYKSPASRSQAKFSVNGNDYEMTAEEFETYVSGTGDFAYKITTALTSNYQWSELNTEQKLYALEKTYEFSRAYWKKKIKPEYSPQAKWISELCGTKVDFAAYARVIVNKSKEK